MTASTRNGGGALPDPVVIVGGAQRSGTTLFRNMLTAHPDLAVPDESPFVVTTHARLVRRGRPDDTELAWRLIRDNGRFKQWQLEPRHVETLLAERPPRSYAELVRILFAAYAKSRGKRHSGDKTTGNALTFEWLAALFPASRFVHVLRDPREVCMSLALQSWNRGGVAGAARAWRAHVAAARAAKAVLGTRLIEVRYEDLVANAREQLERVCDFIEIPFQAGMLAYGASEEALPRHSQDVLAREPIYEEVRNWRRDLSRDDIAVIELVAGRLAAEVGYSRAPQRPTVGAVRALARERAQRTRDWWMRHGAPRLNARIGTRGRN